MRKLLLVCLVLFAPLLLAQTWRTSIRSTNFVSTVVVSNSTKTEQVTLTGEVAAIIQVLAPAGCNPQSTAASCHSVPIRVLYSVVAVGVGQSTTKKYLAWGTSLVYGTFDMPGAFVWNVDLYFLPPSPILSRSPVTLQAVTNANFQGIVTATSLPPAGLVSWWQGEGNAVDAMGRNPGTLGEVVNFVPGKAGQAFSFAGQGYIETAPSSTLQLPTLTAMAWVRHLGVPGPNNYVLSQGAQACTAASYGLYTDSGNLYFGIYDGTNFVTSPDAGARVWDGNWHLVAGTYDGQFIRMYVDGAEVGPGTPSTMTIDYALPTSQQFNIGAYRGSCELPFNGDIDEVRIFNRALSTAEIQGVYNSTP